MRNARLVVVCMLSTLLSGCGGSGDSSGSSGSSNNGAQGVSFTKVAATGQSTDSGTIESPLSNPSAGSCLYCKRYIISRTGQLPRNFLSAEPNATACCPGASGQSNIRPILEWR